MSSECPHCLKDISRKLEVIFQRNACELPEDITCPECDEPIDVEIEAVPIFIVRRIKT